MPDQPTINEMSERLDGPVHEWFGLSYSNYLVLHRSMMQSMPVDWQVRVVAVLKELHRAFAHVEQASSYIVEPAREKEYDCLTDAERRTLGVTCSDDFPDPGATSTVFWDRAGVEHEGDERVLVPLGDDPVPHYNRGRTFLPSKGDSDA